MKTAKPAAKSKRTKKGAKSSQKTERTVSEPGLPKLEPDHPNFDTILLRRARLEVYRERKRRNRPDLG